jgi:hypothetical protein
MNYRGLIHIGIRNQIMVISVRETVLEEVVSRLLKIL